MSEWQEGLRSIASPPNPSSSSPCDPPCHSPGTARRNDELLVPGLPAGILGYCAGVTRAIQASGRIKPLTRRQSSGRALCYTWITPPPPSPLPSPRCRDSYIFFLVGPGPAALSDRGLIPALSADAEPVRSVCAWHLPNADGLSGASLCQSVSNWHTYGMCRHMQVAASVRWYLPVPTSGPPRGQFEQRSCGGSLLRMAFVLQSHEPPYLLPYARLKIQQHMWYSRGVSHDIQGPGAARARPLASLLTPASNQQRAEASEREMAFVPAYEDPTVTLRHAQTILKPIPTMQSRTSTAPRLLVYALQTSAAVIPYPPAPPTTPSIISLLWLAPFLSALFAFPSSPIHPLSRLASPPPHCLGLPSPLVSPRNSVPYSSAPVIRSWRPPAGVNGGEHRLGVSGCISSLRCLSSSNEDGHCQTPTPPLCQTHMRA
ncbi:unnamed protein product [Pleuronectes platessa]|uniref:Uncharacterized protein n=1 Tax=Pleuronectes platessa TaxID=8262 RepID=A0A9N7ULY2_PLEPL|nr:unnamed protein product [Pleuronectes platessa]